jgi:hypothetical protein
MTRFRFAFAVAVILLALPASGTGAGVTTNVVDIPLPRGARQRILYVRPDAPVANLMVIPGGDGFFGFTDAGEITANTGCTPYYRTRDAFAARGIAVAFVDQASDFAKYQYADILEVAQYMRVRDGVPTWMSGGSASTKSAINFAVSFPAEDPLGLVVFSPSPFDAARASLVQRPALVIVDAGDATAKGGALHAALTSAPVNELVTLFGGTDAGCGYHLFNGVEAEFAAAVAGFIDKYNGTLSGGGAWANYQGIWWNAPANSESGWGINFAHQGDTVFASWFTYDTNGKGWWLVMTAQKTAPNTYSGKLYQTRGPAFSAATFDPAAVVPTEVGTGTLTFADASSGTFAYTIGGVAQTKTITRQAFGPVPNCAHSATANLAAAGNYQDLWWKKPGGSESGWGINLNHQGDTIFATWFTYDLDGSPLWLVVTAQKAPSGAYTGELYRTAGARFDAFRTGDVVATKVGTATFTLADGNNATFDYTVQLAGMASPATQSKAITRESFGPGGTTCR